MSTVQSNVYAIYKQIGDARVLEAVFPPNGDGVGNAIEFGEEKYGENFHAAKPIELVDGEAWLKKEHGVRIYTDEEADLE